MKKYHIIFIFYLILLSIVISGCSTSNNKAATISVNADSEYVNTFENLSLGLLYDFTIEVPQADERWITLWVEKYHDGEKETHPLMELSYGNSPNEKETGKLGFGLINPNGEDTLGFLYGPNVSIHPSIIEMGLAADGTSAAWDYAIGEESVELELGETRILAAYRETTSNTIRSADFSDEHAVERMIAGHNVVLLLKIKIEESVN